MSILLQNILSLIALLCIVHIKVVQTDNLCPIYGIRCRCDNEFTLTCDNFNSLDELDFLVNTPLTIEHIILQPLTAIVFDYTASAFTFLNKLTLKKTNTVISLSNFNGFNVAKSPFLNLRGNTTDNFQLHLNNTVLNFYNGKNLIDETTCNMDSLNAQLTTLFLPFNRITFYETVIYPKRLCAKVFQNVNLNEIFFYNVNNANMFSFFNTAPNSNIFKIEKVFFIDSQITNLNSSLLDKNLFRLVTSLNFFNVDLERIEPGLFVTFKLLRTLSFDLNNFAYFVTDLSWLNDLNADFANASQLNAESYKSYQTEVLFSDRRQSYEFGDQDLCLFRNFPHDKLVYPALATRSNLQCSCTVMWLIQYYKIYADAERAYIL